IDCDESAGSSVSDHRTTIATSNKSAAQAATDRRMSALSFQIIHDYRLNDACEVLTELRDLGAAIDALTFLRRYFRRRSFRASPPPRPPTSAFSRRSDGREE